jgi:CRP-like cAMP-binding protein
VDVVSTLLGTYLFQDLSPAELAGLLPHVRRHELPRGAFFYRVGEPATDLWILVSGQAKMTMPAPAGDETVLDVVLPGQAFALPGLFSTGGHRVAESVATKASVALSIERSVLLDFLERHPAAMRRTLTRLSDLVREFVEVSILTAHEPLRARVARRILDLAGLYGAETPDGLTIGAKVPQETLAGMVGATRSRVNEALAELVDAGHIALAGGLVTVRDPERLRADYPDWLSESRRPPVPRGA